MFAETLNEIWVRWAAFTLAAFAGILIASAALALGSWIARRALARQPQGLVLLERASAPARLILPLLAVLLASPAMPAASLATAPLRHALTILLIILLGWLGLRLADGVQRAVALSYPTDIEDNLQARALQTQTQLLLRTARTLVVMLCFAVVLTTFPAIRQIGASLLASAGLAGLVVGFAAKPVLGNLIAGLQIALTQPLRIDDVLIVEGEWGRVEEIGGTYVVIRIWDDRRLIVPLQWFIEHPFQNWTRRSAQLLGTVTLWVDYRIEIEPLRAELERLCKADADWDGRLALLQVTESSAQALQLRALVSASDSGRCWDLRCRVREGLITYIARTTPEYLPQVRAQLETDRATR